MEQLSCGFCVLFIRKIYVFTRLLPGMLGRRKVENLMDKQRGLYQEASLKITLTPVIFTLHGLTQRHSQESRLHIDFSRAASDCRARCMTRWLEYYTLHVTCSLQW